VTTGAFIPCYRNGGYLRFRLYPHFRVRFRLGVRVLNSSGPPRGTPGIRFVYDWNTTKSQRGWKPTHGSQRIMACYFSSIESYINIGGRETERASSQGRCFAATQTQLTRRCTLRDDLSGSQKRRTVPLTRFVSLELQEQEKNRGHSLGKARGCNRDPPNLRKQFTQERHKEVGNTGLARQHTPQRAGRLRPNT
jgi:hypothetical protein